MVARDEDILTPIDVPLGDLSIEASAGTGKTYALTTLAARAVVEGEIGIHRLLVVTFTVAATAELRQRVRRTLRGVLAGYGAGDAGQGDAEQGRALRRRWRDMGIEDAHAAALLARAVRDLDRASILTIHGFCQRLLTEFAFDGGMPFGFEVSGDDAPPLAAAVRDFWRRRLVDAPTLLLRRAEGAGFAPSRLAEWAQPLYAKRDLIVRGAASPGADLAASFERAQARWQAAFAATRDDWRRHGRAFLDQLAALLWHKRSLDKRDRVFEAAQRAFAQEDPRLLALEDAGYLGGESLPRVLYAGQALPESPLLAAFDRLGAAARALAGICDEWLRTLRRDLLEELRENLHEAAWRERELGFDALLMETARALEAPAGGALARRVRERFPLALVDEFQDTDGLQAAILERIYPRREPSRSAAAIALEDDAAAPPGGLIIVGDPKQSIYRFRGADVFAYLRAKKRAGERELRLATNYRAVPALVGAVNAVFERAPPFVLRDLAFQPARPSDAARADLRIAGGDPAPLQLRLLPLSPDGMANKDDTERAAAEGAAAEIASLVRLADEGRAKLRGEPLAGGDIAVLVRTIKQGAAVAAALRQTGVQSVEIGDASVYETEQAAQLQRLLGALAEPDAHDAAARLRGAVAAQWFGLDAAELAALGADDRAWASWEERFRDWRRDWQRTGVARVIRGLLFAPPMRCAALLLALPDGPRQLTNLLHLADLLRQAETREARSPRALVAWLAERRNDAQHAAEEAQLRLQSDDRLVKVVTVHRAKGLEFPVVFCPFAWYRRHANRGDTAQHHEADAHREVLELAPDDAAFAQERLEDQSEEARLLYVALTRARYRCIATWAQAKDAHRAPLAWLLHGHASSAYDDPSKAWEHCARRVKGLDAARWEAEVRAFAAVRAGEIGVSAAPRPKPRAARVDPLPSAPPAQARRLGRTPRSIRRMTSYSALLGEAGAATSLAEHVEVERPDHDQREAVALAEAQGLEPAEILAAPSQGAYAFPRGRRVGDCLHELLEVAVAAPAELAARLPAVLSKHGIEPRWRGVAGEIVHATLHARLSADASAPFRLADVAGAVAEMEFHLPAAPLDRAGLGAALAAHGYGDPFSTERGVVEGYLRGFIDLVAEHDGRFYVVDYKSNWLGDADGAYSPAALRAAMAARGYHLQYLLYLTALNRHLRERLPGYDYDEHMGGACYLFVRAMTPARPGQGVFFDRPSRQCIDAVDACFGASP